MIKLRSLATCAILATTWLALGCSSAETQSDSSETTLATGTMSLPLSAVAPSGVEYRLRNAEFTIWGWPDDCREEDCAFEQTISSEDYLDQPTILLDLLQGGYDVYLNDGWQLERIVDGVGEVVEAQLLNDNYQYAYVTPYRTTWLTYQFGVGDEELWFTGQLEIRMDVYEDPEDYYGGNCDYWTDGDLCYESCCREFCDPFGCWGECWIQPIPCEEMPDDGTGGAGGAPAR